MMIDKHLNKTVRKLEKLTARMKERIFIPVAQVTPTGLYQTTEPLNAVPDRQLYSALPADGKWGGDGIYGWFKGDFVVPKQLEGKALFAYPKMTFYEATLWINGRIHSNYAAKFIYSSHGNHYCNRICAEAKAGERFAFDLECYAYHLVPGCMPLETEEQSFVYTVGPIDICIRDDELMEFMFDLNTLLSLQKALPEGSFRRAEVENALYETHLKLYYDDEACGTEAFYEAIWAAWPLVKEQLSRKNGSSAPWVGLIGHSHMDTAWLWPLTETDKKCARTYANQLNLMEEYPEYRFVQSSAYHGDIIRRLYPELFARIQKAVEEGRYEPNGGVWVECDCNLTGGEAMIRQFVWGQKFTQKYFGYTSDSFWLPDTFGYSFAIPQIMKGCGVDYFLTTKIAWGDATVFPYTSFWWQGVDGTQVLAHMNRTHIGPSPETLHEITDGDDPVREKRVAPMRLFSYGKGDGGGGPEFEEIEMARRITDLDGVPRSGHQTVGDFMRGLEANLNKPSVYAGELYLELHRGTLTMHHDIKKLNRKLEMELHNLELAAVWKAVCDKAAADDVHIRPLVNTLLVHQFHDILPGTSIHSVNAETRESMGRAIEEAQAMTAGLLGADGDSKAVTLTNTLSFDREETFYLPADGEGVAGYMSQKITDMDGNAFLAVRGMSLPAFGAKSLRYTDDICSESSPFCMENNVLTTPFARITFDENGFLASMIDLRTGRELVNGLPFGTLLMAEDIPEAWDNWDIDADLEDKFVPAAALVDREIVADGCVEMRIRCTWRLSEKCTVRQDMIFDAHSPLITFDTEMDWQEEHRFLKAAFDTSLHADGVRNEIQFGCIRRSNHRSTDTEKARFEICNHKYSDLSENSYGIALLNDCKYGLSVNEGSMRLSLHKGGMRPDLEGDKGIHRCRYAILPHIGGFAAENVVRPAYQFNYEPVVQSGCAEKASLVKTDAANVIVETVKPCEDAQNAYILRLYEAVGDWVSTKLAFGHDVKALRLCNMLEEEQGDAKCDGLVFRPFEIKTVKVYY
ncbi:MAG: alpha-mannosidase [Lachnospiraceae bacterium]|nr:alpha-mannosidase [Lachnospiraceae bacterium]